ncbi:MAG: energy transducer TonB [Acidobacteriia bacterium]|nr:energy transducer TonB [Terriglobia bacterium]
MKPHFQAQSLLVKALFLFLLSLAGTAVYGQEARKAIVKPSPEYPELARRMRLSGTVKIQVVIAPNGQVKDTKVVGGHPLLVAAATSALQKWKFSPGSAETSQLIEFEFHP